jgi:hypothetical protein
MWIGRLYDGIWFFNLLSFSPFHSHFFFLSFVFVPCVLRILQYPTPIPLVDLISYPASHFTFLSLLFSFKYRLHDLTWPSKGSGYWYQCVAWWHHVGPLCFSSLVAFRGFHPARSRAGVFGVFFSFSFSFCSSFISCLVFFGCFFFLFLYPVMN